MKNHSKLLEGKKILFLSVQTFNLEKDIIYQLEKHGAHVIYFDERPANNNFTKGMIRIKKDFLKRRIQKYYDAIFEKLHNIEFDFLLVNRGEVVTKDFLEKFIRLQPNCQRVFYTWDSFQNLSNGLEILDYFHKKFTFDKKDAELYGIGFRPLYFNDRYREVKNSHQLDKTIDLLFLGTAHSDRYIISNNISEWCQTNGLTTFNYYYMQGKLVYFYKKFFDSSFGIFDFKKLSFKGLTPDEVIDFYKKSNVILDISHPGQSGLTMRTFEAIGAGKKLITTNNNIKSYPFYNPNNIHIIDRTNVKLDRNFFSNQYEELDVVLYEKCSIDGWVQDVLLGDEANYWHS